MEEKFKDGIFTLSHERLRVMSARGMMPISLDESGSLIRARYPYVSVAPVQIQGNREFLAMMAFDPSIDLTFSRASQYKSSVVGFSLDEKRLMELMGEVMRTCNFIPYKERDSSFERDRKMEFGLERYAYDLCVESQNGGTLDDVWGAVKYSNLLHQYFGVPSDIAQQRAERRFGIV
ncbi:MAG: hypothetical protein Q8P81_03885 [Nanoarchaeota archaeon]|nr:hypothetical protein [Nanoarchaeota archaeon]